MKVRIKKKNKYDVVELNSEDIRRDYNAPRNLDSGRAYNYDYQSGMGNTKSSETYADRRGLYDNPYPVAVLTPQKVTFAEKHAEDINEWGSTAFVMLLIIAIFMGAGIKYRTDFMRKQYEAERARLAEIKEQEKLVIETPEEPEITEEEPEDTTPEPGFKAVYREDGVIDLLKSHVQTMDDAPMTSEMQELYDMNPDTIGWLSIDDTVIDYVVMQTPEDEEYYLDRDFQGNYSAYGCLLADTDSQIGSGTEENNYADGSIPCTNIIIHGHNMRNGSMFGDLDLYRKQDYEKEHSIIKFSSLYEEREYEICAVFLSQVYEKTRTDVFKYYKFFQADTEEEFDDFYNNIKKLSLYDTGVTAEFGDEFITLSVCAYHTENGRLVVVGKRVK